MEEMGEREKGVMKSNILFAEEAPFVVVVGIGGCSNGALSVEKGASIVSSGCWREEGGGVPLNEGISRKKMQEGKLI